jgi:hypothetical protein
VRGVNNAAGTASSSCGDIARNAVKSNVAAACAHTALTTVVTTTDPDLDLQHLLTGYELGRMRYWCPKVFHKRVQHTSTSSIYSTVYEKMMFHHPVDRPVVGIENDDVLYVSTALVHRARCCAIFFSYIEFVEITCARCSVITSLRN